MFFLTQMKFKQDGTNFGDKTIRIGAINNSGSYDSTVDVDLFKLYDGDTLIRDFVPAIRESDGKSGFVNLCYPTSGEQFYSSENRYEFEAVMEE